MMSEGSGQHLSTPIKSTNTPKCNIWQPDILFFKLDLFMWPSGVLLSVLLNMFPQSLQSDGMNVFCSSNQAKENEMYFFNAELEQCANNYFILTIIIYTETCAHVHQFKSGVLFR